MFRFAASLRKRTVVHALPARRPRLFRPGCTPLEARCLLSVTLTGSNPPVPLVGAPVTWTATASDHGQAPVYQFRVGPTGGPAQVVRDFSPVNTLLWSPTREGTYDVQVTVKDNVLSANGESAATSYHAGSRVVGSLAVVSPTPNPLVALYSAPPSAAGSMHVEFAMQDANPSWTSTADRTIVPGESTNVFVAGMRPETTYLMRDVLSDGTTSAPLTFRTGALPANLNFPTFRVQKSPSPGTGLTDEVVFHVGVGGPDNTVDSVATDLAGNVVWYYDPVANTFPSFAPSLVTGGTVLLLGNKQDNEAGTTAIREVDLAGNLLRETNIDAVNAELTAMGQHTIKNFNHDAQRLPNGHTAVLAKAPRVLRIRGKLTRYDGDMVVVLDQNFQVAWVWDPFTKLDVRRRPTLGESLRHWTHANSIAWSPADGNLIVSMRSQDWVVKINYANGTGDGNVVWRLGKGGDFRIRSQAKAPWFSHQHDARYINDSTIVLFDNGNVRQSRNSNAQSRGQVLVLDEARKIARLVVNANLGAYAPFTGSAQKLPSGNLNLDSPLAGQTIEMRPNGRKTYVLKMKMPGIQYRTYIFDSLYDNGLAARS